MRTEVGGVLLAAGAGSRFGCPKALVDDWLARATLALKDGGCSEVVVVLGAAAEQAKDLVPAGVRAVVCEDWSHGIGHSLRSGLSTFAGSGAVAALVHLVDLPDVGAPVVRRLLGDVHEDALKRATYAGVPGHPVLLGRRHWAAAANSAIGDQGARPYLRSRQVELIECGDLAGGRDIDVAADG